MIINDGEDMPDLTEREVQIIHWVAHGLTSKEIAIRADIAPRTVERHIENSRLKMRARNRVHMISKAIAAGIVRLGKNPDHLREQQLQHL